MTTEDKLREVISRMISAHNELKNIAQSSTEYFFEFQGHVFSLQKRSSSEENGPYFFYIYPKWSGSTEELSREFELSGGLDLKFATFTATDLGNDGLSLLESLYGALQSKIAGVDDVLDDILGKPFF